MTPGIRALLSGLKQAWRKALSCVKPEEYIRKAVEFIKRYK